MNDGTEEEFGPGDVGYLSTCAVAVTCSEGSTTVTPPTPPTATCVPPTVGGQTATLTDGTCTAILPPGTPVPQLGDFVIECRSIPGSLSRNVETGDLRCTFSSTPPT